MIIRNFTWADLPALVEFVNLVQRAGGDAHTMSLSSLKEELAHPGLAPEENCFFFEDDPQGPQDGGLRAYFVLHPELRIGRAVLELGIHPTHKERGIEREVVKSALTRAKGLGARVLHISVPPSEFWRNLLEEEGFSQVRCYWMMQSDDGKVPSVELPQGFVIESFRPGDEERLTQVQNASFDGSWGFCPNTVEEVSYRAGMSVCTPEGILLLTHGDDTAGYCWTFIEGDSQNPVGVIGMIGIVPAYRGRGLGRPILGAGMEYLQSFGAKYIKLDVDGENSAAIGLYTSVGFKKANELHWFEARLSGV